MILSSQISIGKAFIAQKIDVHLKSDYLFFTHELKVQIWIWRTIDFNKIGTDLISTDKQNLIKLLSNYPDYFIVGVLLERVNIGNLEIRLKDLTKFIQTKKTISNDSHRTWNCGYKIDKLLKVNIIRAFYSFHRLQFSNIIPGKAWSNPTRTPLVGIFTNFQFWYNLLW